MIETSEKFQDHVNDNTTDYLNKKKEKADWK